MRLFNLVICILFLVSCEGLNEKDLENLLKENQSEFEDVSNQFLNQTEIKWISIPAAPVGGTPNGIKSE